MPQIGTNVRASLMHNLVVKTAGYTAVPGDFVLANAATAGFTVTLPSNPSIGSVVAVKKTDSSANIVTILGQNASLIDGDASALLVSRSAGADFVWDGTNWWSAGIFKESSTPAGQVVAGRKNYLRNGDIGIAQRGNGSFTASNVYTADGWMKQHSGGTHSVLRLAGFVGADAGMNGARDCLRSDVASQSAVGDFALLQHRIEHVNTLAGKVVTLSFLAYAASGTPKVGVEVTQYFGSTGSAQVNATVSAVTLSTTWTRYSVTFTVPSIVGKSIGGGNDYLGVNFWTSAGTTYAARASSIGIQNGIIDITDVQLEEGALATTFERLSQAEQLVWCQRYYWRRVAASGSTTVSVVSTYSSTTSYMVLNNPVRMRATPVPSWSGAAQFTIFSNGGSATSTAIADAGTGSVDTVVLQVTHPSATVGGNFMSFNGAGQYIEAIAEL